MYIFFNKSSYNYRYKIKKCGKYNVYKYNNNINIQYNIIIINKYVYINNIYRYKIINNKYNYKKNEKNIMLI